MDGRDEEMSRELRLGIAGLQPLTTTALAVLAIASGIYTYIGVRGLLEGTGLLAIGAALAYSGAVSVGIFVFWEYILRFLPRMRTGGQRMGIVLSMIAGSLMIVAMSSWLNAAALAGSAAVSQHLAYTIEAYQERLEQANENAQAAQSLLPDIRIAQQRFEDLSVQEQQEGTLTGTAGRGTVEQYLAQMSQQLATLGDQIETSQRRIDSLFTEGTRHLARMREIVSATSPIAQRSIAFANEAVALTSVITEITQTSVAPAVRRQAEDLSRSFIVPAIADGQGGLADRQDQVLRELRRTIDETAAILIAAADDILDRPPVESLRFTPLSPAEAVIMYADAFVPSWAGAIAIDLLPVVIVFVLMVVEGAIRRTESGLPVDDTLTLRDMRLAMEAYRRLRESHDDDGRPPADSASEAAPASDPPASFPARRPPFNAAE